MEVFGPESGGQPDSRREAYYLFIYSYIAPHCLVAALSRNHWRVWALCMLTIRLAAHMALPLLKGTVSSHAGRAKHCHTQLYVRFVKI